MLENSNIKKDKPLIRLSILGSTGKMGQQIQLLAEDHPDFSIAGVHSKSYPNLFKAVSQCDVIIDFSSPTATRAHLEAALAASKPIVIGTTGHLPEQEEAIRQASQSLPILYSANFSFGIALCLRTAKYFGERLGENWRIKILETHHVHKKDSPSGTAYAFARSFHREVPILSTRAGEVVGEHTLIFESSEEKIEIKHTAHSRSTFAQGALLGARFLLKQPPGLYTLTDLIESESLQFTLE